LLDTAINKIIDNEEPGIPEDFPDSIVEEIKKYYRGLNFMASKPYFDIMTIKDMKKEATKTYHIIKLKVEQDGQGMERRCQQD